MAVTITSFKHVFMNYQSTLLDEISNLEDTVDRLSEKRDLFNLNQRKMILSVLKDIESMSFQDNDLFIRFNEMYATLETHAESEGNNDNHKMMFYHMNNLDLIKYKLSKSTVKIEAIHDERRADITYDMRPTSYEDRNRMNPHDNGYNCWGGWGNAIKEYFNNEEYLEAIQAIHSRLKQFIVTDGGTSVDKLRRFHYEVNHIIDFRNDETLFTSKKNHVEKLLNYHQDSNKIKDVRARISRDTNGVGYGKITFKLYDDEFVIFMTVQQTRELNLNSVTIEE